jgi:hypothetical protein
MKIAFINSCNELNINQAMFYSESRLDIDLFAGARLARKKLKQLGHTVFSPYNFSAAAVADVVVFLDRPRGGINYYEDLAQIVERSVLVDGELDSWLDKNTSEFKFDVRLTYHPSAWNGKNVRQFNAYAVDTSVLKETEPADILLKPPGFSMLSTNHMREYNGELYSSRRAVVNFLLENCPKLLTLGGRGWDSISANSMGIVDNKKRFLKSRQFNFCFENCSSVAGYVTEKILEAILCGCIPIYYSLGHDKGLIPANVYINAANFDSWQSLVSYCLTLSPSDKVKLVYQGKDWLTSTEARCFQLENSLDILLEAIIG